MSVRLPLLLLVALTLPLAAQKTKPSGKAESGITVRLLADEVPEGQGKVLLQTEASKSEAVDLPTAALSAPIAVSARKMELKAADSEVALGSITLPAEGKSFAVLLAPEKPTGYIPFVVRLDDDSFNAGDLFFINRSAKTVVLKLGGNELVLEAGKAVKARPTDPVDNAYYVVISERDPSGDKLITSSRWPVDSQLRSYIFFSTNAKGRTTFRAVDEYLEPTNGKKKR
ncbi:MAG: hypothetical protein V4819_18535 [Verrucomicrobiota bacterium]